MKKCKICHRHVRKARKGVCLQCETERDANKNARTSQAGTMPQPQNVTGLMPTQDNMIDPAMMMVPGNYMAPYFPAPGAMNPGMNPSQGMGSSMPLWMLNSSQNRMSFPMDGNILSSFDTANVPLGNGSMVGQPQQMGNSAGGAGAGGQSNPTGSGSGAQAVAPQSMPQLTGGNFNFGDIYQQAHDYGFATPPPSGTAPLSSNPVMPSSGSQATSLPSFSSPQGTTSKDESGE